ncbi:MULTISPECIES: D-2-hydroxyacid dehydrogenase [Salinibaculum]|uniref:D-2-hydroxyacid dehydrogenase n=1 Tax=Salinibaculum TaxID=2732368 RepID=UPI0030D06C10
MKKRILVLRRGTEGLSTEPYATYLREQLPSYDVQRAATPHEEQELIERAWIATGVDICETALSRAEYLEMFACAFSGINHLPLEALKQHNVAVTNAGGIHAPGLAEQVIGYILMFSRRLHEGLRQKQRHEWRHYQASELTGSTVTIVGLGSIGLEVTKRLQGFEVNTIGVRYTPSKGGPTDRVIGFDPIDFHDALAQTDYLVLASPLTETTRGIISREELITLPPHATIVNIARGGLIDTDDLVWALRDGAIRAVALDVTDPEPLPADHPLWTLGNVLITPHMGGHTPKHWERLAAILVQNVTHLEGGGEIENLQNLVLAPETGL